MFEEKKVVYKNPFKTDEEEGGSHLLKNIRRAFLRGLAIVIPVFITVWLLWLIFQFIDGIASPFYRYVGLNIPGLGFLTAIILILLLGIFSRYLVVKFFFRVLESIFLNLPLTKTIYSGARELINAFSPDKKGTFQEVCMIEYPRKGLYTMGFITNEIEYHDSENERADLTSVYIPLPPNPTTGMLTLIPTSEVIPLSISVEQGLKMVLSAGIVTPHEFSRMQKPR
ncbi:DUF502 domain-containing protein [Balneolales bacterium ANBcel1]|nr:DUF502 domain-containing protein [Balneolales bacterium ANBcel1]